MNYCINYQVEILIWISFSFLFLFFFFLFFLFLLFLGSSNAQSLCILFLIRMFLSLTQFSGFSHLSWRLLLWYCLILSPLGFHITDNNSVRSGYNADNVTERDFLRTEGDPGAAGYTIKEALALARSMVSLDHILVLSHYKFTLFNLEIIDHCLLHVLPLLYVMWKVNPLKFVWCIVEFLWFCCVLWIFTPKSYTTQLLTSLLYINFFSYDDMSIFHGILSWPVLKM